jgi:hypothetical protein
MKSVADVAGCDTDGGTKVEPAAEEDTCADASCSFNRSISRRYLEGSIWKGSENFALIKFIFSPSDTHGI